MINRQNKLRPFEFLWMRYRKGEEKIEFPFPRISDFVGGSWQISYSPAHCRKQIAAHKALRREQCLRYAFCLPEQLQQKKWLVLQILCRTKQIWEYFFLLLSLGLYFAAHLQI